MRPIFIILFALALAACSENDNRRRAEPSEVAGGESPPPAPTPAPKPPAPKPLPDAVKPEPETPNVREPFAAWTGYWERADGQNIILIESFGIQDGVFKTYVRGIDISAEFDDASSANVHEDRLELSQTINGNAKVSRSRTTGLGETTRFETEFSFPTDERLVLTHTSSRGGATHRQEFRRIEPKLTTTRRFEIEHYRRTEELWRTHWKSQSFSCEPWTAERQAREGFLPFFEKCALTPAQIQVAFRIAINENDFLLVKTLIAKNAKVNSFDETMSPLASAIVSSNHSRSRLLGGRGQVDATGYVGAIVRELLVAGARPGPNDDFASLIRLAPLARDMGLVELFFKLPEARLLSPDDLAEIFMSAAFEFDNRRFPEAIGILEKILDRGANLAWKFDDDSGDLPSWATHHGSLEVLKILRKRGAVFSPRLTQGLRADLERRVRKMWEAKNISLQERESEVAALKNLRERIEFAESTFE